ncbi:DUF1759 domain-containing protein [Wolbachia endosymbiont of Psylliodes chrysocephala]|uniref:DUF1759 domain-containing protein n=1 Tax=Wolbachia endosymbiont of Psylliodes chrysocephala TaxID=2883236 RepID=UPI0020A06620|nr:DUF1759 domain-containing protein [Wolbachia endosymbiont of Psylliodes chrysocephala]
MADLTSTRRQDEIVIDENVVRHEEPQKDNQPRQVQKTTEEPCSSKYISNNDNVLDRSSINKSKKSSKNSRSTSKTERRKLEIEAERQIFEIEKKLILNKLALDKLTVNEDFEDIEESEITEVCNSVADDISFKVSTWLKSNPADETAIPDMERETGVGKIRELSQGYGARNEDTNLLSKFQTTDLSNDMENCIMRRHGMDRSLPNFDGNPADWLVFISEFNETSKLCHYSDSENLVRLRKCLKGEARESVKMLLISHLNVSEIIDTLENNYGRPQYIIKYMIEQVKSTPPIKDYKPESIVKFSNSVCNLVTAIKHLKNDVYLKNPLLLDEFVNFLTISLRRDWSLHAIRLKEPTLLDFSIWLKNLGKASGLLCTPNFKNDYCNPSKKSESVLLTDDRKKLIKDKCRCCGNIKHPLQKCQKFQEMNVDNRWLYVSKNKLCISCLKPNHHLNSCFLKKKCGTNNCQLKHTPLLHKDSEIGVEVNILQQNPETETIEPIQIHQQKYSQIILRTIPVEIEGPKGKKIIYALLDEGSTITLIDKDLATDIGLTGYTEPLCMQWTNNQHQTDNTSQKVSLKIKGTFSDAKSYILKDVRTIDNFILPSQSLDMKMVAEHWPYLKNLPINSFNDVRPKMLIGTDNYDLTMPRHYVENTRYDPKATLTKLGWVINGQIVRGKIETSFSFHVCERNLEDDMLHTLIQDTYKLHDDNLDSDIPLSRQDQYALTVMEITTRRISDRFETGLIWRNHNLVTPESKTVALNRLFCNERKMDKDLEFGKAYCEKIEDYLNKGYLKNVTNNDGNRDMSKLWYLPHFAVFNKPGKMQVVFDAAAKSHGISLNDMLFSGPDLLKPLIAILWTFRQYKIAFCGDIAEMFHQVQIREKDRAAQRILWRGYNRSEKPSVLEMQVMTFGATCSPSLAQYVKNKNASEFKTQFPEAYHAILNKHYVDDYLDSCDSESEAIKLIDNVILVHKKGGFLMRNWLSNSKNILLHLPEDMRSKNLKDFSSESTLPIEKILGVQWDPEKDEFKFKLNTGKISEKTLKLEEFPTKREVLKVVMSIFDPLGFLNNIIIKGRILLQNIWRENINWDEKISPNSFQRWKSWINELGTIKEITIPRCYSLNIPTASNIQLHSFSDASQQAYSAVVYLRISSQNGVEISFLSSKSKVCPLKEITIPRLELQASLLASKLVKRIKESLELRIDEEIYWTDSRIVLSWIQSDKNRLKQYVRNRVQKILESSNKTCWRWLPTKLNPADHATRDENPKHSEAKWLTGPAFLHQPFSQWPEGTLDANFDKSEMTKEMKMDKKEFVGAVTTIMKTLIPLPDCQRFSSWTKLVRTTAWVIRFLNHCRNKKTTTNKTLTVEECSNAELEWWRKIVFSIP